MQGGAPGPQTADLADRWDLYPRVSIRHSACPDSASWLYLYVYNYSGLYLFQPDGTRPGLAQMGMALAESGPEGTRAATAEYIQGMARELRTMAAKVDMGFLAYLLSMVEQEAQRAVREAQPGGPAER